MIAKDPEQTLNLVDASIQDLANALATGSISCVDLVTAYLVRISTYDCRGPALNSIPIINPRVYNEAMESDARRAIGKTLGLLDGIPFTVKDSYKVKGLTVASGSPAFQDLMAQEDAFTVQKLREAGAVLIGKSNMCPMAAGGMQRGIYGRAESPYNTNYLAAAFASGSSNGSGVSTAASFAAFGMGEETVSSGRSPASNNALVAYTPSQGAISIRGNWPLYPTCDVVVPHTRTVDDLLAVLDIITVEDSICKGDFWRDQTFVKLSNPWRHHRTTFCSLPDLKSLKGLRIAVPSMYIGGAEFNGPSSIHISHETIVLYQQAKADLERLGATVIEVADFPVMRQYGFACNASTQSDAKYRLPSGWNITERSALIAYAWEQFLQDNDDYNFASLRDVNYEDVYPPHPPNDPQIKYAEPSNRIHYEKLHSFINPVVPDGKDGKFNARVALMSVPDLAIALKKLEAIREDFFEKWLTENHFDVVMFPACGDVGAADADVNCESAEFAWRNGVKYSNGNRMIRHLGIPSITVPMGAMDSKEMPIGLTFLAAAGEDLKLIQWARTYEKATKRRTNPKLAPSLSTGLDQIVLSSQSLPVSKKPKPQLQIEKCIATPTSRDRIRIDIEGFVTCTSGSVVEELEVAVWVDGQPVPPQKTFIQKCHGTMCGRPVYDFRTIVVVPEPSKQDARNRVTSRKKIARDSTMVAVVAREAHDGWSSGYVKLL